MIAAPRRSRRYAGWILLLLILGGAAAWYRMQAAHEAAQPGLATSATIARGTVEDVVTAQGKLETREYVDVGAQVSGQLKRVHVEIGDVVKKGQLLAEIDPRVYEARVQADEARLRTLRAQLAEQEAQIRFAQRVYERNRRLIAEQAVSQELLEDSETSWKTAEARASSLQAQIEEAQSTLDGDRTNLTFTKIYAPIDGTVVLQSAQEGQTLNAVQSAPVIVQLADLDRMTVRAQVAEADVMRITPGQPAYFTTLGAMEERWQGTVRQVLPSPEVINEVVLYNALIDVDNSDRRLMTGMSVQVFFVLGRAENVPLVPLAALRERVPEADTAAGEAHRVQVKTPGGVESRVIHLGIRNRRVAAVLDGLEVGDQVLLPAAAGSAATPTMRMPPRL
ncbi:MAG TPA: efflux RND transporter periplasmic adaptor subunit [Gammaproteobacteria bacterium]|nr:efflux RND transporter periplasmic adaptor subunit [Gammaproteobacteria bacterium]